MCLWYGKFVQKPSFPVDPSIAMRRQNSDRCNDRLRWNSTGNRLVWMKRYHTEQREKRVERDNYFCIQFRLLSHFLYWSVLRRSKMQPLIFSWMLIKLFTACHSYPNMPSKTNPKSIGPTCTWDGHNPLTPSGVCPQSSDIFVFPDFVSLSMITDRLSSTAFVLWACIANTSGLNLRRLETSADNEQMMDAVACVTGYAPAVYQQILSRFDEVQRRRASNPENSNWFHSNQCIDSYL